MILVKGYGQMCNNILQYAHLYAFGREYGAVSYTHLTLPTILLV